MDAVICPEAPPLPRRLTCMAAGSAALERSREPRRDDEPGQNGGPVERVVQLRFRVQPDIEAFHVLDTFDQFARCVSAVEVDDVGGVVERRLATEYTEHEGEQDDGERDAERERTAVGEEALDLQECEQDGTRHASRGGSCR